MVRTRWMVSAMLGALILVALEAGAAKTPDKRPPAESASTARAQSRNLLVNPGFEDGSKGSSWMPAGWDTSRANLPTVLFTRDQFNVHGGKYAVSVASASGLYYMAHNWSQTVLVGPEAWNKDAVFSVWTRSSGVEGRAYVVLQAYRDTISKMAKVWGMDRLDAGQKLGINAIDDPLVDLGWKRAFFPEPETDWVRREVRVFVPPSVSVLFVRCGVIGTGQLVIDDASLTLEPAQPAPEIAPHANLLVDPGFEGDDGAWEYSLPPYPTMKAERDTTIAHSGKASLNLTCGGDVGIIQAQSGVCQVVCNRSLGGKHIKLSGFMKTDTLQDSLDKYRAKIAGSARNRAAAYELALASGRNYKPGDQISYYIKATPKKVPAYEAAKLASDFDSQNRDENVDYYVAKLDELVKKFSGLTAAASAAIQESLTL